MLLGDLSIYGGDYMDKIKVIGEQTLSGKIYISGSKNSAVALIPAAILSDKAVIDKVPNISDGIVKANTAFSPETVLPVSVPASVTAKVVPPFPK